MVKQKIHLISVTYHNYGSLLQTFALQTAIRNLGFETEIVSYKENKIKKINRLLNFEYLTTRFKMVLKKIKIYKKGEKYRQAIESRNDKFTRFINSHFSLGKSYTDLDTLAADSKDWEIALLGSDQVWHPINYEMHYFTLEFVDKSVRKIAYAPSFGVSKIPIHYQEYYKSFLQKFDYLSCREISGVELISKIASREALHVCDPTMLLNSEEWIALASSNIYNKPYVFVYLMGNNPRHRGIAKSYAEMKKLKIVALTHIDEFVDSDENYADYTPFNVDPFDFLSLIKNSSAVITDSFHASVFSLLFHKQFFTFNRFECGHGSSTTSRIDSLLSIAGTSDHKIRNGADVNDLLKINIPTWRVIDENIAKFRDLSLNYLTTVLYEAK